MTTETWHTPRFTVSELELLVEALDSHEYWQLSHPEERNDGASQVPDGERSEIDACRALTERLVNMLHDEKAPKRKEVMVCSTCGSRRIQALDWIECNTNAIIGGNDMPSYQQIWCPDCGENSEITTRDKWIEKSRKDTEQERES